MLIKSLPFITYIFFSFGGYAQKIEHYTSFEKAFQDPENVKELSFVLEEDRLTEIPSDIDKFKNLKKLTLEYNHIQSLPESIGNLKNLTHLKLTNLRLKELPESIGKLSGLTTLILSETGVSEIPGSIGNLTNIDTLIIQGTKIREIPNEIGNLKKLKVLNLLWTKVNYLPESIGNCVELERLELKDNELIDLPASLSKLKHLNYLNLIRNFPFSFEVEKRIRSSVPENCQVLISRKRNILKVPSSERPLIQLDDIKVNKGFKRVNLTKIIEENNKKPVLIFTHNPKLDKYYGKILSEFHDKFYKSLQEEYGLKVIVLVVLDKNMDLFTLAKLKSKPKTWSEFNVFYDYEGHEGYLKELLKSGSSFFIIKDNRINQSHAGIVKTITSRRTPVKNTLHFINRKIIDIMVK